MRNVKKTDEKGKRKPVVKWMLVWKKKEIRKGRNNIKRFFKNVLVGARSINNINTFLIFYPPPRPPHKMAPCPPPLNKKRPSLFPTYSRAYKKTMVLLLKISLSLLYSLSYSFSLLSLYNILLFVMNISISEHFAYLLWATNLA